MTELLKTALSAGSPPLRVANGVMPRTMSLPAVVFNIPAGDDDGDLDGGNGLRIARVQIDAWAEDPIMAEAVASEAEALLLASSLFAANSAFGFFTEYEEETQRYRFSRDFSVSF